jgi:hypothetical protein
MRKFMFGAAFAAAVWAVPAWAIIGSTTIKITDGGQPVPTATVTLTFKDKAGKPVGKRVRRRATRVGTPQIKIPDNTATVDISVRTPRRSIRRNSVDVGQLTDKDFTIDVPGGSRPAARAKSRAKSRANSRAPAESPVDESVFGGGGD